ncbi:hypothetical protein DE146DRAFT_760066 [Phaeosphaeria sp. MPI-PUGE-AT-0046c]|nr:hypothetical protein DE146DRAFT_760066 [Phaeosphaeria sp. MPI-PUGE-AT-0046c]
MPSHGFQQRKANRLTRIKEDKDKDYPDGYQKRNSGHATKGVRTSGGEWSAVTYESIFGNEKESDLYFGANIELNFLPFSTIKDTNRIWLIQFVRAIKPPTDVRLTKRGWNLDHSTSAALPFYGMSSRHKPDRVGWDVVRFVKRKFKGKVAVKQGQKVGAKVVLASCMDAPREFITREALRAAGSKTSLYTVYAYDEDNDCWLGGLSWGYTVSWNNEDQTAQLESLELQQRSIGAPLDEELEVCHLWNDEGPKNRTMISLSTSKASVRELEDNS